METRPGNRVALLWDESFLWGLMAREALASRRISFDLVTSRDIQRDGLHPYGHLFVPGGWAGDKAAALGETGKERIRDFVEAGGAYVGFCGGAGLALDVDGGMALLPVRRLPSRERIPNFSGSIEVLPARDRHPLWKGLPRPVSFYAWWPGQFLLNQGGGAEVVARYGKPGPDFFVADLKASDVEASGRNWEAWEETYGIHMDPSKLRGAPAILEGAYGKGRVFLSYLHLDTPHDAQGLRALENLFSAWPERGNAGRADSRGEVSSPERIKIDAAVLDPLDALQEEAEEMIRFGERNYLWYWRTPHLLQWRRGIRGMEQCILVMMIRETCKGFHALHASGRPLKAEKETDLAQESARLRDLGRRFFDHARRLLMLERHAMNNGVLHHLKDSEDQEIQELRELLFSRSRRFGGTFKDLLDGLDRLLLPALRSL